LDGCLNSGVKGHVKYSVWMYGLREKWAFRCAGLTSLSSRLPRPLSSFLQATEFFFFPTCLPFISFTLWGLCFRIPPNWILLRNSPFGLESWNTFWLQWVFAGGPAWCCTDFGVFCVWLIYGNAIQLFCSVCYEIGAFLSLFVYLANVCSCKVYVCVFCVVLLLKKWVSYFFTFCWPCISV